jgi:hypothetical protein
MGIPGRDVSPGRDPSTYAILRATTQRNLFRVRLLNTEKESEKILAKRRIGMWVWLLARGARLFDWCKGLCH